MKSITLEQMSAGDAIHICRILQDNDVKKTYMVPDLSNSAAMELAHKMIRLSCDESRYVRGIYLGNTLVGILNDVGIYGSTIELGWVIDPTQQGKGFATAAVRMAIEVLFGMGYTQVIAGAFSENAASIRVMEKAGMVLQDKTEEIEYRGQTHKCVYYAMKKETPL